MTDAPKLLPCPFCGEADQDTLHIQHMERTIIHPTYRVACDNCGGSSGWTDRNDHVEEWNRRATPEALSALAEAPEVQALIAEAVAQERAEIDRLREALIWCSGSDDFQDGGFAREGWLKLCVPLLKGDDHE